MIKKIDYKTMLFYIAITFLIYAFNNWSIKIELYELLRTAFMVFFLPLVGYFIKEKELNK